MPRIIHLWNGKFDIADVAEAVRAEFPGVYHRELITEWLTEDSLKRKSTLFHTKNPNTDFLRFQIMLSDMIGHAIRLAGPNATSQSSGMLEGPGLVKKLLERFLRTTN